MQQLRDLRQGLEADKEQVQELGRALVADVSNGRIVAGGLPATRAMKILSVANTEDSKPSAPGSLSTPSVAAWACSASRCTTRPLRAQGKGRRARGAARSRVGLPEPVAPAAPNYPKRR